MHALLSLLLLSPAPVRAEVEIPDLQGLWRLELVVTSTAKVPVLGDAVIETHTVMLAEVRPDGHGGYRQHHKTCRIEPHSSLKVVQTSIPASFVAPMPDKEYPLQLTPTASGAWQVAADFGPQHIAYDPARSGGRPPETAEDPALLDWEGDGHPGATIHLSVPVFGQVEVYIAQLAHTRLRGTIQPDGQAIQGMLEVLALQQRSVGASPGVFASNPQVTNIPERSTFSMKRVAPGTTCAAL